MFEQFSNVGYPKKPAEKAKNVYEAFKLDYFKLYQDGIYELFPKNEFKSYQIDYLKQEGGKCLYFGQMDPIAKCPRGLGIAVTPYGSLWEGYFNKDELIAPYTKSYWNGGSVIWLKSKNEGIKYKIEFELENNGQNLVFSRGVRDGLDKMEDKIFNTMEK